MLSSWDVWAADAAATGTPDAARPRRRPSEHPPDLATAAADDASARRLVRLRPAGLRRLLLDGTLASLCSRPFPSLSFLLA